MKFHLFVEASQALLDNCVKTLARELDTRKALLKFCSAAYGTKDETMVLKLMSMMDDLPLYPPCSNWQETPCKSGRAITSVGQVRPGTIVAPNPSPNSPCSKWSRDDRGETVVTSTAGDRVMVQQGKRATKYYSGCRSGYLVKHEGFPQFLIYCRKW